jgi:predicted MFS family arabinose efflux permease
MGMTQGVLSSVIAESSKSKNMIGTAFAVYYAIDGICLFCGNWLAGIMSSISPSGPFIQGAMASAAVICYLFVLLRRDRVQAQPEVKQKG